MRILGEKPKRLKVAMLVTIYICGTCLLNGANADPFQNGGAAHSPQYDDQAATGLAPDQSAEPLPDWVQRGSYIDDGTQFILATSAERSSELDAEAELWTNLKSKIDRKINELIAPEAAKALAIDHNYIREHLLVPNHIHKQTVYLNPSPELAEIAKSVLKTDPRQYQYYALAKLDREFEVWARTKWEERLILSRVQQAVLIGISVLFSLILLLGYFQLDHKTRGFYSGRLQTITLVIVLVLVVAVLALSNSFDWL